MVQFFYVMWTQLILRLIWTDLAGRHSDHGFPKPRWAELEFIVSAHCISLFVKVATGIYLCVFFFNFSPEIALKQR